MKEEDIYEDQFRKNLYLQRDQTEAQDRWFAPQAKEAINEAQAAIINQTNPSRALNIILDGFRGIVINEEGVREQIIDPIMNEKGIARIASFLLPFVNDPMRFGNITEKEVKDISLKIINDITLSVGLHWREFGIKNDGDKDIVIDSCMALIFVTLTRSENQGEKNWLSKIVIESLNAGSKMPSKKKESWYDKLKF